MKRPSHIKLILAAFLGLVGATAYGDALAIDAQPIFEGRMGATGGVTPLTITVSNDGPDATGSVSVQTEYGNWEYPVELPRGAHKKISAFPVAGYGFMTYSLVTNKGVVSHQFPPNTGDQSINAYLLVSDQAGDLAFLRATPDQPNENLTDRRSAMGDAYVRPENAPSRPVAYAGMAAIVLGAGAERLSDKSIQGLKSWAMAGGTIVFLGGASSPTLMDARWQKLLPMKDFHTRTLATSRKLGQLADTVDPPSFAIQDGTPVGATNMRVEGDAVLYAERPFGLGKIAIMTFNPLDRPLSSWDGRKAIFTRFVRTADGIRARQFLASSTNSLSQGSIAYGPYRSRYGSPPPVAVAPAMEVPSRGSTSLAPIPSAMRPIGSLKDDPFAAKLPETSTVLWILGAYFVLVVPVNFLVLRALKRGEWAWFTAPVISLAFAAILFRFARGLYDAKMSVATSGVIIAQEGNAEGIFSGESQMFFPQAGSYDLGLTNVDTVGMSNGQEDMYNDFRSTAELNAVDVGEVKVPALPATNLAFREMTFTQVKIPAGNWVALETRPAEKGQWNVDVVNQSAYPMENCIVYAGVSFVELGSLAPGERKNTKIQPKKLGGDTEVAMNDLRGILGRYNGLAFTGNVQGFRPGPQIGKEVEGRRNVNLVYFANPRGFEGKVTQ